MLVKVQKTSILTFKKNEMEIEMTEDQLARYEAGVELVQHIFPPREYSAEIREFLINGITPEESPY